MKKLKNGESLNKRLAVVYVFKSGASHLYLFVFSGSNRAVLLAAALAC
jgi:hypothetical protein